MTDLKLSYRTVVDKRGRVVIRKKVREAIGLPVGGPVEWEPEGNRARLRGASSKKKNG